MTELVFDRTQEDVLLGTEKGCYGPADLNRVETAVEQIQQQALALDIHLQLSTKTDWKYTDRISPDTWPTQKQMQRYLQNVAALCSACSVQASLPATMEKLDWDGANRIEAALHRARWQIYYALQIYRYSGEVFAGEENIL